MSEICVLFMVAVPCLAEHRRNVSRSIFLSEGQRVFDVSVVFDTTVFTHLHVIDTYVCMKVVTVASVIAVEGTSKHAVWLGIVVANAITVVNLEAQACPLIDVCGKITPDAIFASLPVAA